MKKTLSQKFIHTSTHSHLTTPSHYCISSPIPLWKRSLFWRTAIFSIAVFAFLIGCSTPTTKKAQPKEKPHIFSTLPLQKQGGTHSTNAKKENEPVLQLIIDLDQAKSSLQDGNIEEAAKLITGDDSDVNLLPKSRQLDFWKIRSDVAYKQHNIKSSLNAERQLHSLLTENGRIHRFEVILDRLLELDRFSLQHLSQSMKDNTYAQDWISLVQTVTNLPATSQQQKVSVNRWQQAHKLNPISKHLPSIFSRFFQGKRTIRSVALLLPTSGPLAQFGTAIQQGFQTIEQGLNLKTTLYNVHNQSTLQQTIEAIRTNPVDAIVGPIDKKLAEVLWQSNLSTQLLTLNYLPSAPTQTGYAQFGLGVEDEAQLLASIGLYGGKKNTLVITQDDKGDKKGKRAFSRFKSIVPTNLYNRLAFQGTKDLAKKISQAVGVSAADIKQYRNDIRLYKKDPEAFTTSPTEAIISKNTLDAVVLFANQLYSAQVKPLLEFYYALNTPVLATSLSYALDKSSNMGEEYEGMYISDIPVLHRPFQKWHTLIRKKPQNFSAQLTRFYALGVDAAIIISNLPALQAAPGFEVKGTTGSLGFDQKTNKLVRNPDLYVVQGGKLIHARTQTNNCSKEQRLCL